jgi:hypothetical protein
MRSAFFVIAIVTLGFSAAAGAAAIESENTLFQNGVDSALYADAFGLLNENSSAIAGLGIGCQLIRAQGLSLSGGYGFSKRSEAITHGPEVQAMWISRFWLYGGIAYSPLNGATRRSGDGDEKPIRLAGSRVDARIALRVSLQTHLLLLGGTASVTPEQQYRQEYEDKNLGLSGPYVGLGLRFTHF